MNNTTVVPPGVCLTHGGYGGLSCPYCQTALSRMADTIYNYATPDRLTAERVAYGLWQTGFDLTRGI